MENLCLKRHQGLHGQAHHFTVTGFYWLFSASPEAIVLSTGVLISFTTRWQHVYINLYTQVGGKVKKKKQASKLKKPCDL